MSNRGMSLIEILVIIIVLIVLSTLGHASYRSYVLRAKVTEAIKVLEEYQTMALSVRAQNGSMDPYYVLFGNSGDTAGFVSGSPGSTTAVKTISLKYVTQVTAKKGTSGTDTYILLGAKLAPDGVIVSGSDMLYLVGLETTSGVMTWKCGQSSGSGSNLPTDYVPPTCVNTVP